MHVRVLKVDAVTTALPRLAEILVNAVAAGAGVSFLYPLSHKDAVAFWQNQIAGIQDGNTFLFVCEEERGGEIAGLVMLQKSWAPNQLHRADVAKLLVHSKFQRRGIASALMLEVERYAISLGLKLITFDAVAGGGAEKFYRTMGYTSVGIIPGYAYSGNGKLDDTMFFYKSL
jgi:acetyltransferase